LILMMWLIWPFRRLIHLILSGLFTLFRIPNKPGDEEVSEDELKVMISSGEVSQVLEEDEREMIDGVFDLRHLVAAEIMTPRPVVQAIPDELTQAEVVQRLREAGHNRVLVYHESLDELVGFLLVKEVLLEPHGDWQLHLREPVCVPEGVGLLDLLKTFRRERTKMAVVVDEYGGVAGIVTLQDLLEEIVGDIYEKHEPVDQEIHPLAPDVWRVAGSASLLDLADTLDVDFPEDKGRTVGGFIMNTLARIPVAGDEVAHRAVSLRVEEMAGRRVHLVTVRRAPLNGDAREGGER
jgi:putative hemolysin